MAASSVPGYKRQNMSFSAVEAGLMPQGAHSTERTAWTMPQGHAVTSFSQGESRYTGNVTDVALQGNGFFEVQMTNGSLGYTRDGEFSMNGAGQLAGKGGNVIMGQGGPIQLDRNSADPITISSDGTVSQGTVTRGQLKVMKFDKPEMLNQASGGVFIPNAEAGLGTVDKPNVRQFYLEAANTSTVKEMANMITVMRSSEANQRVIQMQDERMGKAISELGNPN